MSISDIVTAVSVELEDMPEAERAMTIQKILEALPASSPWRNLEPAPESHGHTTYCADASEI